MGKTIATCCHKLTKKDGEYGLGTVIAIADDEGVSYITVCNRCLSWYKKRKLILSEEDVDKVLRNSLRQHDYFLGFD